jgi:hypothetical protein
MQRRQFCSHAVQWGLAGAGSCCFAGCGTLFHSERCGQPHSSHIDWKVAALDGLGLLLFFVPGVIAFVVDFSTGAIYLPMDDYYPAYGATAQKGLRPSTSGLRRVAVAREELRQPRIEQIIGEHVGQSISLAGNQIRLSPLRRLDQFAQQLRRHQSDADFGAAVETIGWQASS